MIFDMMEKIFISVEKSSRMISLTKKYIGNDLENLQQELVFKFTDEFVNGSARMEYQIGGNKYHIPMTKDGETYTVPIKNVITKEGKIPMQLVIVQVAQDEEIPVFKSNVFDMYCNKSINAQEEAPDDYEYWLDVIQAKLADIDDALEQVDNLDIDATKTGSVATVSITNKDGVTKSVEITDGETGATGQDGFSPTATVSKTGDTATISITDKNGTTTATISDGEEYDDTEIRGLIAEKQDELVSGTNIKTINNTSILGNGNIDIQGGSDTVTINYEDTEEEIIQKLESIFDENGNIVKNAVFYLESNLYFLVQGGIQSGKTIGIFSQVYPGLNEYLESEKTWYECFALSVENNELSIERTITQLADRNYLGNREDLTINEEYAATHPGVYDRYDFRYAIDLNYSLAKGTQKAISFSDYQTMITRFNTLGKDYYNVGQSVYIVTLNVPDLWVSGMGESSSTYTYVDDATFINDLQTNGYVQVGYHRFSMVESKKTNSPDIHVGPDAPTDNTEVWIDTDDTDIDIPSKTSELVNDSGFVNADVNNLNNYYKKSIINEMFEEVWDMIGGALPSGYKKVDYLQGTGTQYIDLGFMPHTGIVAKGKYTGFTQPLPVGIATPMGVMSSSSNRFDLFSFGSKTISGELTPVFGLGYKTYTLTDTPIVQGQIYEVEAALKNGEQHLKVDGNTIFSDTVTGDITATANMLMFNRYKNGAMDNGWYEGKIYYAKIWQDNVLIRDMVPCLDSSNVPCFFDRVNKQTYYNAGTGEFIYELPEIPDNYTRLKYIESTGTQYINTGITPTTNTGIDMTYCYNQVDANSFAGVCGIYKGTNPRTDVMLITTSSGKTNGTLFYAHKGATASTGITVVQNELYNVKINWLNNSLIKYGNTDVTISGGSIETGVMHLFGRKSMTTGNYDYGCARIYSCRFSQNNTVSHHFVPCLDDNNIPCFYDVINKQTYYNEGTGVFIYGTL